MTRKSWILDRRDPYKLHTFTIRRRIHTYVGTYFEAFFSWANFVFNNFQYIVLVSFGSFEFITYLLLFITTLITRLSQTSTYHIISLYLYHYNMFCMIACFVLIVCNKSTLFWNYLFKTVYNLIKYLYVLISILDVCKPQTNICKQRLHYSIICNII